MKKLNIPMAMVSITAFFCWAPRPNANTIKKDACFGVEVSTTRPEIMIIDGQVTKREARKSDLPIVVAIEASSPENYFKSMIGLQGLIENGALRHGDEIITSIGRQRFELISQLDPKLVEVIRKVSEGSLIAGPNGPQYREYWAQSHRLTNNRVLFVEAHTNSENEVSEGAILQAHRDAGYPTKESAKENKLSYYAEEGEGSNMVQIPSKLSTPIVTPRIGLAKMVDKSLFPHFYSLQMM